MANYPKNSRFNEFYIHPKSIKERKLRLEWAKWEATCHPDDSMPFVDFAESRGLVIGKKL